MKTSAPVYTEKTPHVGALQIIVHCRIYIGAAPLDPSGWVGRCPLLGLKASGESYEDTYNRITSTVRDYITNLMQNGRLFSTLEDEHELVPVDDVDQSLAVHREQEFVRRATPRTYADFMYDVTVVLSKPVDRL